MIGSLGFAEVAFIVLLALLIFGPRRLPELARSAGKAMGELRRATDEVKRTFNTELALDPDEAPRSERRPSLAPKQAQVPAEEEVSIDPTPRITAAAGVEARQKPNARPRTDSLEDVSDDAGASEATLQGTPQGTVDDEPREV